MKIKLRVLLAGVAATALSLAGPTSATPDETKAGAKDSLGMKDSMFVKKAAKGGMREVRMGEMAQKEGQSDDVKKIGEHMAMDHTKVNQELMALAEQKGLKLPAEKIQGESKMAGADFDKKYLAAMVKDHEKDIAEFENAAKNAEDAELKAFAEKNLPTLKEHLKMVRDAQAKMH